MLGAGKLNKRITIQRATSTQDAAGEVVATWETLSTVWAKVKTLTGSELVNAKAVESRITVKVIVRKTDVLITDRIIYGSRTLEILSVIDAHEQEREYHISCAEVN